MTSEATIDAEGVRKSFGATVALAGVDLHADAARVVALLGPNGAGKSTLVRILTSRPAHETVHPAWPADRH